jgi:NAD(P)H-quinone oxidoreductase subunit 4
VISCLLVPIVGIGLYPRIMTDTYRASIETLVAREESALTAMGEPPRPLRAAGVMGLIPPLLQAPSLS